MPKKVLKDWPPDASFCSLRKEKLQERVDEWMSSMVWKMKEEENKDKEEKGTNVKKKKKSSTRNG